MGYIYLRRNTQFSAVFKSIGSGIGFGNKHRYIHINTALTIVFIIERVKKYFGKVQKTRVEDCKDTHGENTERS